MQQKIFGVAITVLLLTISISAQEKWKLVKEDDGISIYTKPVSGSDYTAFKGEMQVNARLEDILEVLRNTKNINNWVSNCKEIKLLKTDGNDQYYYIQTSLPWPFENRDNIYHYQYMEINSKQVRINVTGIPDYTKPIEGIVRILEASGYWLITSIEANKLSVTYQMHVEPGGVIPAWLANSYIQNVPFSTFKGLRRVVQK